MTRNTIDFATIVDNYASPEVAVVEIAAEGPLCQSGQFEQWKEEEIPW